VASKQAGRQAGRQADKPGVGKANEQAHSRGAAATKQEKLPFSLCCPDEFLPQHHSTARPLGTCVQLSRPVARQSLLQKR
jgi:hypothetical protein